MAFMIVYANVSDPARLHEYAKATEALFAAHGGKLVARGQPAVLEGEWPWQVAVIFSWPSRDAAEAVWRSEAYAALKRRREGAAELLVVVVDALPADIPPL